MSDALAALRQTFFEECEEQLADLESGLLQMQDGATDKETVNAVFRAVHSVKGGAGAFKLNTLVHFAHIFETALDEIRSDTLEPSPPLMKAMLRASDVLADLVAAARSGEEVDESVWKPLAEEIGGFCSSGPAPKPAAAESSAAPAAGGFAPMPIGIPGLGGLQPAGGDFAPMPIALPMLSPSPTPASGKVFNIVFRPRVELYEKANEAVVLLREIERLGQMNVVCDLADVPLLDTLDPLGACLAFDITLRTERDERAIRDVFEFCEEDCDLTVIEGEADADEAPAEAAAASGPTAQEAAVLASLVPQPAEPEPKDEAPKPAPRAADSAKGAEEAAQARAAATPAAATIRVDLDRVDRLINLVGELVINQAMLAQAVAGAEGQKDPAIAGGLDELDQLTREIQESVMAIRAQPLKPLFQRMSRIVREVADATGKKVRLVTDGEWTEVDKTVVERLADPLTHMIRNAIDHGLESPEKRMAAGKSEEGLVRLSAAHRSGRVVITISDDGAGINRERVKQIAIDKGLIPADAQLTETEIDNLIFLPGFSTQTEVSAISGRGVGMDVVKRSIHALSGRIFVKSRRGLGSEFTLSLPLTLAVLDGMVVSVEGQILVAPLSAIVETMSLSKDKLRPFGDSGAVIADRDGFVPLIDTASELGFRSRRSISESTQGVALLVESEGGGRTALLVDQIQDQRQVVIKSLETNYGRVPGVAAATILGDGRVALILDVDALVSRAKGAQGADPFLAAAG
jgi:two-component system chemotaxis sensor kinase CheA